MNTENVQWCGFVSRPDVDDLIRLCKKIHLNLTPVQLHLMMRRGPRQPLYSALKILAERYVNQDEAAEHEKELSEQISDAGIVYPQATLLDILENPFVGMNADLVDSLRSYGWFEKGLNLLITGPARVGKSYLASAVARGLIMDPDSNDPTVRYVSTSTYLKELAQHKDSDALESEICSASDCDLLILDDFCLTDGPLSSYPLLRILEERNEAGISTILVQAEDLSASSSPEPHPSISSQRPALQPFVFQKLQHILSGCIRIHLEHAFWDEEDEFAEMSEDPLPF